MQHIPTCQVPKSLQKTGTSNEHDDFNNSPEGSPSFQLKLKHDN